MFNIPNLLTLSRIVVIPVFVAVLWFEASIANWLAFGLFVFASVTDFFDGYLARRLNEVSAFGRFLDPIADKLLVAAALLMLVEMRTINGVHILPTVIILSREIVVSGLREYLAEVQISVPVSKVAKWKTAAQMIAICVLLVGSAGPLFTLEFGLASLWVAAILTIVTGYDYLRAGIAYMATQDHTPEQ